MRCEQCGSVAVAMIENNGAVKQGSFVEKYECEQCGALGRITGMAEAPADWKHKGSLFNEY